MPLTATTYADFINGVYVTAGAPDTFINCFNFDPSVCTGPLSVGADGLETFPTNGGVPKYSGSLPIAINQMSADFVDIFTGPFSAVFGLSTHFGGLTFFAAGTGANPNLFFLNSGALGGGGKLRFILNSHVLNSIADNSTGNHQLAMQYDGLDKAWWSWDGEPTQLITGLGVIAPSGGQLQTQFYAGVAPSALNSTVPWYALYPGLIGLPYLPVLSNFGPPPPMIGPAATHIPVSPTNLIPIKYNNGLWR